MWIQPHYYILFLKIYALASILKFDSTIATIRNFLNFINYYEESIHQHTYRNYHVSSFHWTESDILLFQFKQQMFIRATLNNNFTKFQNITKAPERERKIAYYFIGSVREINKNKKKNVAFNKQTRISNGESYRRHRNYRFTWKLKSLALNLVAAMWWLWWHAQWIVVPLETSRYKEEGFSFQSKEGCLKENNMSNEH